MGFGSEDTDLPPTNVIPGETPGDTSQRSTTDQTRDNELSRSLQQLALEETSILNPLSPDIQDLIFSYRSFSEIFQSRAVCRAFRDLVKRKNFQQARSRLRPVEYYLSPLVYYVRDELWHILGLDYEAKLWRALPPFPPAVPAPDTDLFKDFLVACHRGLFLANVGKPLEPEKLLVCNPLTESTRRLPPLMHTRHPVLLHLHVTLTKTSFLVIAVGSSASGTETLSRKTEVYDSAKGEWEGAGDVPGSDFSRNSVKGKRAEAGDVRGSDFSPKSAKDKWAEAGDVPGSDFSLNDFQTGVFCERENLLLCVGFMVNGMKGILAFDIGKREWRQDWICPFLAAEESVHFAIAQLVECDGAVYLFSEQESGRTVTHCIDRLDFVPGSPGFVWTRKVTRPRHGYRALLVYPEYTCAPVGQNKLCIFNAIERTGVVYNMSDDPINPESNESIPAAPPLDDGVVFHSLNPVGYAFEPSFGVSVRGFPPNSNVAI